MTGIDIALFRLINNLDINALNPLMVFITRYAYLVMLIPLLPYLAKGGRKSGLYLFLILLAFWVSDAGSNVLKHIFERPRPFDALSGVVKLVSAGAYSFPSSHASNVFAAAAGGAYFFRRLSLPLFALAALIAFSRIYVGVHYPSDTVAGALWGVAAFSLVLYSYNWVKRTYEQDRPYAILAVTLVVVSVLRFYFIAYGPLGLAPDEAHYWEWSRRLGLSYYSKGPVVAYLIAVGTFVFGDNPGGVRFMAVVLSALGSLVLYGLGRRAFGPWAGLFSALLLQAVPLFAVYGVVMTIDSPYVFFWLLSLYLFYLAVFEEEGTGKYWLLLGVSVGLGMLSKYTMALFYMCAFLFLLERRRDLLLSIRPYTALLVSIVVFLPEVIWNMQNNWVTVRHTLTRAGGGSGGGGTWAQGFLDFTASQIGLITPVLFVLVLYSLFKVRREGDRGVLLFWFSAPVLAFFALKGLQGKVEANWAMAGWLSGLVAFSGVFIKDFTSKRKSVRLTVGFALALSLSLAVLVHVPSVLGLKPQMDPTAKLRGWKELSAEVTVVREGLVASGGTPVFVFSDRYQVSSELAFYMHGNPVVYCADLGNRRMNQYDLWPGFEGFLRQNAIFVTIRDVSLPGKLEEAFDSCEKRLFTVYENEDTRLRDYSIFKCLNFKGIEKKQGPWTY